MGNPFTDNTKDVLVLDTQAIMDHQVAETIRRIWSTGLSRYKTCVAERIDTGTRPLSDPIKSAQTLSKDKQQITSLKQNCVLFPQLYVSCQLRS